MRVAVISEAACTWRIGRSDEQHLRYARKSIMTAKGAGCDAWKTQWTSDPKLMAERRTVLSDTYGILAWPAAWLPLLAKECERVDIEFMCSVFLPQDVATIAPFVKRFKIASLESLDNAMYAACYGLDKPLIVSLGAAGTDDIKRIMGATNLKATYLQCVSSYPASLEAMNLRVIREWCPTVTMGLSDHSCDTLTGALAVASGASMIETHFRLDETTKNNPDFLHSLSANGLTEYVMNCRKAEIMIGDGVKSVHASEQPLLKHRVHA
jgi:sialic acid synthase SpsE